MPCSCFVVVDVVMQHNELSWKISVKEKKETREELARRWWHSSILVAMSCLQLLDSNCFRLINAFSAAVVCSSSICAHELLTQRRTCSKRISLFQIQRKRKSVRDFPKPRRLCGCREQIRKRHTLLKCWCWFWHRCKYVNPQNLIPLHPNGTVQLCALSPRIPFLS